MEHNLSLPSFFKLRVNNHNRPMNRSILIIPQFLISAGILYYLFTLVSISHIFEVLRSSKLEFLVMALVVTALSKCTEAYRMKMITDGLGMGIATGRNFQINLAAVFYELFLPSYVTGGAVKWYKLSQSNKKRAEAFAAIALNRIINLIMLILVGTIFWTLSEKTQLAYIFSLVLVIFLGLVLLLYTILINNPVFEILSRLFEANRLRVIPNSIQLKLTKVTRAFGHFQSLTYPVKLQILGTGVLQNLFGALTLFLFIHSLEISLSFINIAWIHPCEVLVTMLPISVAGLGVREGSLAVLLSPFGVALEKVLALSFLILMMRIFWGVIGGIIEGGSFLGKTSKSNISKQAPI